MALATAFAQASDTAKMALAPRRDLFSVPLQRVAPKWDYGRRFVVQLLYAKEPACITKTVMLPPRSERLRKRLKDTDPLTYGEANAILNGLEEEQDEAYVALPDKGGRIDSLVLKILLYKIEAVIARRISYCARTQSVSIDMRPGLRGAMRGGMPQGKDRRSNFYSSPQAFCDFYLWA